MVRLFAGFGVGFFAGYLLGLVIPIKVIIIAGLVLLALAIVLFFVFHLSIQAFQE